MKDMKNEGEEKRIRKKMNEAKEKERQENKKLKQT